MVWRVTQPVARFDEPMSAHSAWRTGGPCHALWFVPNDEALTAASRQARERGWRIRLIGAATRTVFRDAPLPVALLRLGGDFARIEPLGGGRWRVGAAVPVPALIAATLDAASDALLAWAHVPGSFGASLAIDDGWEACVEEVMAWSRGAFRPIALADARRRGRWIGSAVVRADPSAGVDGWNAYREWLARGRPNAPSAWLTGGSAADVRERVNMARLQTVRLRSVAVPAVAPELLVNLGGGSARDLAHLHQSVVARVKAVQPKVPASPIRWMGPRDDAAQGAL